jgi:hypothetical protein
MSFPNRDNYFVHQKVKQLVLELVETTVVALALYTSEDNGRTSNFYKTAERCFITAVVVNACSVVPLWALVTMYRIERVLLQTRNRSGSVHFEMPPGFDAAITFSRVSYVLLDILSDYFQFVASLYIVLSREASNTHFTFPDFISCLAILAMGFGLLEVHGEVAKWAGSHGFVGGTTHWLLSRMATIAFLAVAFIYYVSFLTVTSEAEKAQIASVFTLAVAVTIFGYIGFFLLSAMLERCEFFLLFISPLLFYTDTDKRRMHILYFFLGELQGASQYAG